MTKLRSPFGSYTRATDGCIVTFQLENGERIVERFAQILRTTYGYAKVLKKEGDPYLEQAAQRADELGAQIVCISTPDTILRDLKGTRDRLGEVGDTRNRNSGVRLPESSMLGKIGRLDLLL